MGILSCAGDGLGDLDQARVVAVRDGDTIELDDGRIVRYIGINTPERGRPGADSATDLNRRLVEGRTVRLAYGYDLLDRYGRTLAIVYADGRMVNREIVRAGWAWCYFFNGNLRDGAVLVRALQEAMQERRGIWAQPHEESAARYIASFSGFRFHRPDCESVFAIKRHNEVVFTAKDSAFFAGYSPCAACRP